MKQNEQTYTDENLILAIKTSETQTNTALKWFYKEKFYYFFNIRKKIPNYVVSDDELLSAFHDSLIELRDKIQQQEFELKQGSSIGALFYFIFRCNSIDIQRKNSKNALVLPGEEDILTLLSQLVVTETSQLDVELYACYHQSLATLKNLETKQTHIERNYRCSDLLRLRSDTNVVEMVEDASFQEIAELFNFTSAGNARVAFFNCKQKLIDLLKLCFQKKGLIA